MGEGKGADKGADKGAGKGAGLGAGKGATGRTRNYLIISIWCGRCETCGLTSVFCFYMGYYQPLPPSQKVEG